MYLLDTDVLIWISRNKKEAVNFVNNLKNRGSIHISTITIAEIYKNIFISEISTTEDYINQNIILGLDIQTAKQAGFYWQKYSKNLKGLSIIDCIIAATAMLNDLKLVTYNTKHFPMNDIKVIVPK